MSAALGYVMMGGAVGAIAAVDWAIGRLTGRRLSERMGDRVA